MSVWSFFFFTENLIIWYKNWFCANYLKFHLYFEPSDNMTSLAFVCCNILKLSSLTFWSPDVTSCYGVHTWKSCHRNKWMLIDIDHEKRCMGTYSSILSGWPQVSPSIPPWPAWMKLFLKGMLISTVLNVPESDETILRGNFPTFRVLRFCPLHQARSALQTT